MTLRWHLRAWIDYGDTGGNLYYWRTRAGVEVDFVAYTSKGVYALEIKNTTRVQPQDLRGLRSFRQDYPESKTYLLYRGPERLSKEGILCLPCDEFLRSLRPGAPIASVHWGTTLVFELDVDDLNPDTYGNWTS